MSRIEKRLESWRNSKQPAPIDEVEAMLNRFFPEMWYQTGSHIVIRHPILENYPGYRPGGEFAIAVRNGQKVLPCYLKELYKAIRLLIEEEQ